MSNTPPIDADALLNAIKRGRSVSDASVETSNPFAKIVADFEDADDFADVDASPSVMSLEDGVPEIPALEPVLEEADTDRSAAAKPERRQSNPESLDEQIAIPTRSAVGMAASTGSTSVTTRTEPANDTPPAKRQNMRGLVAGAAVLLAVVGTGYLYTQGSHPASSETVVYEAPVFDEEVVINPLPNAAAEANLRTSTSLVTEERRPSAPQNPTMTEPSEPVAAQPAPPPTALPAKPPEKPEPFGFDDKFSDAFPKLEGQSLLDLATGVATFAPGESIPNNEWGEVSCGGCHSFNQTNLCEQGAYYFNHDKQRIARIQHPYGGGFKSKLMEWAEGGCL